MGIHSGEPTVTRRATWEQMCTWEPASARHSWGSQIVVSSASAELLSSYEGRHPAFSGDALKDIEERVELV